MNLKSHQKEARSSNLFYRRLKNPLPSGCSEVLYIRLLKFLPARAVHVGSKVGLAYTIPFQCALAVVIWLMRFATRFLLKMDDF